MPYPSHDAYFATLQPEVRTLLEAIQAEVATTVPRATPCISYTMPALKLKRTFFYFAAFQKHIGIYPPVVDDKDLIQDLAPYRGEKGNLSFPLSEPLPLKLIGRVASALAAQYTKP
ncbi:MAG: hypothetical protein RLZZ618_901 [Pseudomonadota bacterium]|jgi:uncharacterized protein YdhG (YjbR/CyaY superfamily)